MQRCRLTLVLPFTGHHGFLIRNRLRCLFLKAYPQVSISVIFSPSCRISSLFKFKDRVQAPLRSSILYKFSCGGCNATYVGETRRHLKKRIEEHTGISARTGKLVKGDPNSAIYKHVLQYHHVASAACFSIIGSATSNFDLCIKESLIIGKDKPVLNNNVKSLELQLF